MNNYDKSVLGVENPNHPANKIEVIELTYEEQELKDLQMEVKHLKQIHKNMQRIFIENAMSINCNSQEEIERYIKLQELFNHNLNKL